MLMRRGAVVASTIVMAALTVVINHETFSPNRVNHSLATHMLKASVTWRPIYTSAPVSTVAKGERNPEKGAGIVSSAFNAEILIEITDCAQDL